MKTKLTFWGSMLFLLSLSILLTIYLAWIFYPLEIQWLSLTDQVYLKSAPLCSGQESLSFGSASSPSDAAKFLFLCQRDCEKRLLVSLL